MVLPISNFSIVEGSPQTTLTHSVISSALAPNNNSVNPQGQQPSYLQSEDNLVPSVQLSNITRAEPQTTDFQSQIEINIQNDLRQDQIQEIGDQTKIPSNYLFRKKIIMQKDAFKVMKYDSEKQRKQLSNSVLKTYAITIICHIVPIVLIILIILIVPNANLAFWLFIGAIGLLLIITFSTIQYLKDWIHWTLSLKSKEEYMTRNAASVSELQDEEDHMNLNIITLQNVNTPNVLPAYCPDSDPPPSYSR